MESMPKTPLAAMDADGRCRLSFDPTTTVADLELCLEQWMSMMQSRDLLALTATLQAEANWKTTPKLQAMLLYRHLFQQCSGSVQTQLSPMADCAQRWLQRTPGSRAYLEAC